MKGLRIVVPVLLTFTILIVSLCYGYEWDKTFGGSGIDSGYSVQQTPDGGYIIAGSTTSFGAGESDIYLLKTNANGDLVWDKTFGGSGRDEAYSLQQTVEGGYIIVGYTGSFGSGKENVYLIKTDVDGEELWSRTFEPGNFGDDLESAVGSEVHQTADGGYVIIGWVESISSWVLLIKTDADGNMTWWKTFMSSTGNVNQGRSVQQTSDGGYIIAGLITISPGMSPGSNGYVIKTDAGGNEVWSKVYGEPGEPGINDNSTAGLSVLQTTDGDYIIAGYTFEKVYLIRLGTDGNEVWNKTFGLGNGYFVQQTADDGYIIVGDSARFDPQSGYLSDIYLIKTDADGNEIWSRTFDRDERDFGFSVQETTDGGYIIVGETGHHDYSLESDQSDISLIYYKPDPEPESESPAAPPPGSDSDGGGG
jgi:hypothetical protein